MPEPHTVTITFEGSGVGRGSIPFDELLGVFGAFQSAVRHMIEDMAGRSPAPGPLRRTILDGGSLELRSVTEGSFVAEVGFTQVDQPSLNLFRDEALIAILGGLEDHAKAQRLPSRVARELLDISESLTERVSRADFKSDLYPRVATVRRTLPGRVVKLPPQPERRRVSGRLLEIDWKDGTAELHGPSGVTRLVFDTAMNDPLVSLGMQRVEVVGEWSESVGGRGRLSIDAIEPLSGEVDFWARPNAVDLLEAAGTPRFHFERYEPAEDSGADEFLALIGA